jgi:hypothetical protein
VGDGLVRSAVGDAVKHVCVTSKSIFQRLAKGIRRKCVITVLDALSMPRR